MNSTMATETRVTGIIASPEPEMVKLAEASNRLHLSYDYLRKLCLTHKIVHVRAGSRYYVNFGKLVEWLNTTHGEDH